MKPGLKYNKDFVIICGKLFDIINIYYKINYIIKIKKIQEIIDLNNSILILEENRDEKNIGTVKDKKDNNIDNKNNDLFKVYNDKDINQNKPITFHSNVKNQSNDGLHIFEDKQTGKTFSMQKSATSDKVIPPNNPLTVKENTNLNKNNEIEKESTLISKKKLIDEK